MRFLALETNIDKLKRNLIAGDERELITTHRHFLRFVISVFGKTIIAIAFIAAIAILIEEDSRALFTSGLLTAIVIVVYVYQLMKSWISWRYCFIIITTMKVVIVRHVSVFKQDINPIHLSNITSTRMQTQFIGLFDCGKVLLNLKERQEASTRSIILRYVPMPNVIVSTIEKAISLSRSK